MEWEGGRMGYDERFQVTENESRAIGLMPEDSLRSRGNRDITPNKGERKPQLSSR